MRLIPLRLAKTVAPVINEAAFRKKNQEKHDTAVVAKNAAPPATNTDSPGAIPKITNSIKNLFGIGKTETKPRKDTIIIIDTNAAAKNTERKDAIILMPGAGEEKNISKNNATPGENKPPVVPSTITKDSAAIEPVKRKRPAVVKAAELLTDTSYVAIFVEESKGKFDTIRISIPFKEAAATVTRNKPTVKEAKPADNIEKIKKDSPVVIAEQPVTVTKKDTIAATITDSGKNAKAAPISINSDCKEAAFDIDIDKLRIKMMQAVSDEEKITQAKKVYRLKCFSVKQVRALSEVFKTDEGKYRWFDAVYPFVSDNNNFSSLSELIKNEYYLSRFKAMLRN